MERIYITKEELLKIEQQMRFQKHLDRYFTIRQFCHGVVIDAACGVGYGSYIISTNPDVEKVIGVDLDTYSIMMAEKEFASKKVQFFNDNVKTFKRKADMLVSIETIEHLDVPENLALMAKKCGIKEVIVSYPTKKSTHFNPNHKYDFRRQDILDIFNDFKLTEVFSIGHEVEILMLDKETIKRREPKLWRRYD